MFLGEYQHTLDAKGRVSLPAKFRGELTGNVVVCNGLDKCLYVFSAEEYLAFASRVSALSDGDPVSRRVKRFFLGSAQEVPLDSAGRISLTSALRDHASLTKDVVVIGTGERIEIWDATQWSAYNGGVEGSIEDLAKELADAGLF
jgi:MraZ protein